MRFANYPGDVAATFTPGDAKGPSQIGECWFVQSAVYDPTTDRTTVAYALYPPPAAAAA